MDVREFAVSNSDTFGAERIFLAPARRFQVRGGSSAPRI
jgi:hypothetical protein